MKQYKLYRFIKANEEKFIGFFNNESELLTFCNKEFKREFKNIDELNNFLALYNGCWSLKEI